MVGSALKAEAKNPTAEAKVASEGCFTEGKKGMGKVVCETTERKVIEQHRKRQTKKNDMGPQNNARYGRWYQEKFRYRS